MTSAGLRWWFRDHLMHGDSVGRNKAARPAPVPRVPKASPSSTQLLTLSESTKRLTQLDGLRGLAALMVLFVHFLQLSGILYGTPPASPIGRALHSPLGILWDGHLAVLLFFTLSGFVLGRPFMHDPPKIACFLTRRLLRIWPPFALALVCGMIVLGTQGITDSNLIGMFALGAGVGAGHFDPPVWSLVVEIRVSLALPLLVWFVKRWQWGAIVALCPLLIVLGTSLSAVNDVDVTVRYLPAFLLGLLVAKHEVGLVTAWRTASRAARAGAGTLLMVALAIHGGWFVDNDWIAEIASASLIVMAIGSVRLAQTLKSAPAAFVGRVSYSLYLIHAPLMALCHRLGVPLVLSLPGSLLAAQASYQLVERPSIWLSKMLTANIAAQPRVVAPALPG